HLRVQALLGHEEVGQRPEVAAAGPQEQPPGGQGQHRASRTGGHRASPPLVGQAALLAGSGRQAGGLPYGRGAPRPENASQTTTPQRANISTNSPTSTPISAFSSERTNSGRPRRTLASAQGMNARQKTASSVPTQLARAELTTSPLMSRA